MANKQPDNSAKSIQLLDIKTELFDIANCLGVMSLEEVAAALGQQPVTIRKWVARREIPFVTIGRKTAFNRDSVVDWLHKKEFKPRVCR